MTTLLLAAVLALTALGTWSVVAIGKSANPSSTPLTYAALGFVLLGLKQVLAMLQTEFASRRLERKMDKVSEATNGNLAVAVQVAATEAVKAERDQLLNELPLPKTHDELREFVREVQTEACRDFKDAVREFHLIKHFLANRQNAVDLAEFLAEQEAKHGPGYGLPPDDAGGGEKKT
jgi:hypothetical protein